MPYVIKGGVVVLREINKNFSKTMRVYSYYLYQPIWGA